MSDYIKKLISEGEHQRQDFKFEVSDFRKIARTLVAFSNTDGGRLLLGVKDNGSIAGVRSEEEYFMIEGAARIYCKPEIQFQVREWQVEGRKVMEVMIGAGKEKPYMAREENDQWTAYIRQDDKNYKASPILLQVWDRQHKGLSTIIKFRQAEKDLLQYLETHHSITQSKFRRISGLSARESGSILTNFILLELISIHHTQNAVLFSLTPDYRDIIRDSSRILYL